MSASPAESSSWRVPTVRSDARPASELIMVDGVLEPTTCKSLIERAEVDRFSRLAVIDDPILALRLFHRLVEALPLRREGAELTGLKPVLRCLRYRRGEGTRARRDPPRETDDGQRSQLGVVLFLNDDFAGGALELPELGRTIAPRAGRAIVSPHSTIRVDHIVERGRKFVLEAEVFYSQTWLPYRG